MKISMIFQAIQKVSALPFQRYSTIKLVHRIDSKPYDNNVLILN